MDHQDGDDYLSLRELSASLASVSGGMGDKGLAYLFYVADLDHDRALSAKGSQCYYVPLHILIWPLNSTLLLSFNTRELVTELKDFLKGVVDVYCCLVNNVLDAARDELVAVGVSTSQLKHLFN